MVYFPAANVIMTGDFYRSTGYPNIDRANGGTMNGMLKGFDAIIALGRPDTKIIPGHGLTVDKAAVAAMKGKRIPQIGRIEISIISEEQSRWLAFQNGQIDFIDVTVDRATDTVQVRAVFPNPSGVLIDGQLVAVNLEAGKPQEQVVVPQAALITDQQGVYVFVVEASKVAIRRVKTGGPSGDDMVVTEGLSGGEEVIVEGLQTVRVGVSVQPKPATPSLNRS